MRINFRLGTATPASTTAEKRRAVEANVEAIGRSVHLLNEPLKLAFLQHCRKLAYFLLLGHAEEASIKEDYEELRELLRWIKPLVHSSEVDDIIMADVSQHPEPKLDGPSRSVVCNLSAESGENFGCVEAVAKRPAQM
jgi:hypothetical protein